MKTEQIIKTLQNYNDWRRARGKWGVDTFNKGESFFDTTTAHEIGLTIDAAIEKLQELDMKSEKTDTTLPVNEGKVLYPLELPIETYAKLLKRGKRNEQLMDETVRNLIEKHCK